MVKFLSLIEKGFEFSFRMQGKRRRPKNSADKSASLLGHLFLCAKRELFISLSFFLHFFCLLAYLSFCLLADLAAYVLAQIHLVLKKAVQEQPTLLE